MNWKAKYSDHSEMKENSNLSKLTLFLKLSFGKMARTLPRNSFMKILEFRSELEGEVFGPLRDEREFKSFKVDPVLETIVWENGADLAPEFLHENLRIPIGTGRRSIRTTQR